jgi:hypothetical protein
MVTRRLHRVCGTPVTTGCITCKCVAPYPLILQGLMRVVETDSSQAGNAISNAMSGNPHVSDVSKASAPAPAT